MKGTKTIITIVYSILLCFVFSCSSDQKKKGETTSAKKVQREEPGKEYQLEELLPTKEGERTLKKNIEDRSTGEVPPLELAEDKRGKILQRREINEEARRYLQMGLQAYANGRLDEALGFLNEALSKDPQAFQVAYNIGVIYERKGDIGEAKRWYQRALELQPDYENAIIAISNIEVRMGRISQALEFLRDKAREFPKNLAIQNQYGELLILNSRFEDAIRVAKSVLRADERNVWGMIVLAKAHYYLGKKEEYHYDLSEWILEQASYLDPNNAMIYNLKAFLKLERGDRLGAIKDFEKAIELYPDFVEALNNLGVQYIISGNYEKGIAVLEKARTLSPSWITLYINLGDAYRGAKRWEESYRILKEAEKINKNLPAIYYNLAILYLSAPSINNLDKISMYQLAIENLNKYKELRGSALSDLQREDLNRLLKEAYIAMEREKKRIQMEEERKRREAEEAKKKEGAPPQKEASSTTSSSTPSTASEEEGGWE